LQQSGNTLNFDYAARHRSRIQSMPARAASSSQRPELANALGGDTLDALSRQTGMPRDELLKGLSQHLPALVDKLTPNGRLPSPEEAGRMV
jgi:uncharacterized protein YidB (DUF937 family)